VLAHEGAGFLLTDSLSQGMSLVLVDNPKISETDTVASMGEIARSPVGVWGEVRNQEISTDEVMFGPARSDWNVTHVALVTSSNELVLYVPLDPPAIVHIGQSFGYTLIVGAS